MTDIKFLMIKMNNGNNPIFILTNIKNVIDTHFISAKLANVRDSTILCQVCKGSPAAGWIAEKSVRALLEIIRIPSPYFNLKYLYFSMFKTDRLRLARRECLRYRVPYQPTGKSHTPVAIKLIWMNGRQIYDYRHNEGESTGSGDLSEEFSNGHESGHY